jgi:4-hydroxy-2-oxoglutarate aldolase
MTREQLHGVVVPLTTPFDPATGDVAPVALRNNARAVLDAGAQGVVVAGSTGEASMLSDDEARKMVAWLREVVPDDKLLIVGSGRESTRATIAACRDGAEHGADVALVRPPSYFAKLITQRALVDHFRAVADASPIPILVYNMPVYTNLPISDSTLGALADHPNILGAKDSCGDLKNFAAYRDAVPGWAMFIGSGALFYAALEIGAVGGILAVANFAVETAVEVAQAFARGDKAAAGSAQERLTPVHKEIVSKLGPGGVKLAMDAVGLEGGPLRSPLAPLTDDDRERIAKLLHAAQVLSV